MDEALPKPRFPGFASIDADLRLRDDFEPEGLSESELEVLGTVLPELVGELLQMSQDRETE